MRIWILVVILLAVISCGWCASTGTTLRRRYGGPGGGGGPLTSASVLSSRRALIDGDIDPVIAALIVESMHHSVEANRRHNAGPPSNPAYRNRIMTVNKINEDFLD